MVRTIQKSNVPERAVANEIDLVVFGDGVLDYTYDLAEPVRPGGKMLGKWRGMVPGGTGANVACAAAGFGLSVRLAGKVVAGEAAIHRQSLQSFGVDLTNLVEVDGERGSHCVIFRDPDGEKTLAYVPLDAPHLDEALLREAVRPARYAYAMAADLQRLSPVLTGCAAKVCLDLDAAAGLDKDALARALSIADILFVNDIGFLALTGTAPSAAGVASLLATEHDRILCCTGGAGETFVAECRNGEVSVLSRKAYPARVVDTTGAGDCFNAGFLSELARGSELERALSFAMAAGALATEMPGARAAIPSRMAVLARSGLPANPLA